MKGIITKKVETYVGVLSEGVSVEVKAKINHEYVIKIPDTETQFLVHESAIRLLDEGER